MTNYPLTEKPGIFIDELVSMMKEVRIEMPRMIGAGFDMPGFDLRKIREEIDNFLKS